MGFSDLVKVTGAFTKLLATGAPSGCFQSLSSFSSLKSLVGSTTLSARFSFFVVFYADAHFSQLAGSPEKGNAREKELLISFFLAAENSASPLQASKSRLRNDSLTDQWQQKPPTDNVTCFNQAAQVLGGKTYVHRYTV